MKLLMFLAKQFTFRPFEKMLPEAADSSSEVLVSEAAVVFVHSELQDEADPAGQVATWRIDGLSAGIRE